MIVQDSDNLEDIGYDLWKMFISFAILNTVVFFLVIWSKYYSPVCIWLSYTNNKRYTILVIQAEPHIAPSNAQVVQRKKRDDPAILQDVFMSSVKQLLKNNGYILLLISYGINVGAFFAISTLLNQFILLYFPVSKLKICTTNSNLVHLLFYFRVTKKTSDELASH